jgi:hypothetical protein
LNIQPTPSIDTRPFIQPEHFAPLEVKAPIPKKEDLEQMQPPKVIVPLQNEQIKEGAPVLLEATIVGKPTPNVRFDDDDDEKIPLFLIFLLVHLVQKWCSIDCIQSSSYSI